MKSPRRSNPALVFFVFLLLSELIAVGYWAFEVFELNRDYYITRYERLETMSGFLMVGFIVGVPIALIVCYFGGRAEH